MAKMRTFYKSYYSPFKKIIIQNKNSFLVTNVKDLWLEFVCTAFDCGIFMVA